MNPITREQIIVAKRAAMGMYFWLAAAEDDDDGFDRLMAMTSLKDLDNDEWVLICTES